MAEPINLNKMRKARAKVEAKQQAAENRVRFGRAKAEKTLAQRQIEQAARALDQARREV